MDTPFTHSDMGDPYESWQNAQVAATTLFVLCQVISPTAKVMGGRTYQILIVWDTTACMALPYVRPCYTVLQTILSKFSPAEKSEEKLTTAYGLITFGSYECYGDVRAFCSEWTFDALQVLNWLENVYQVAGGYGGSALVEGLYAAYARSLERQATDRHIIIVSNQIPCEIPARTSTICGQVALDCYNIVSAMKNEKICVSLICPRTIFQLKKVWEEGHPTESCMGKIVPEEEMQVDVEPKPLILLRGEEMISIKGHIEEAWKTASKFQKHPSVKQEQAPGYMVAQTPQPPSGLSLPVYVPLSTMKQNNVPLSNELQYAQEGASKKLLWKGNISWSLAKCTLRVPVSIFFKSPTDLRIKSDTWMTELSVSAKVYPVNRFKEVANTQNSCKLMIEADNPNDNSYKTFFHVLQTQTDKFKEPQAVQVEFPDWRLLISANPEATVQTPVLEGFILKNEALKHG